MTLEVERVGTTRDQLGESALWDANAQVLYWVDGSDNEIFQLDPATGALKTWRTPAFVCSLGLRKGGLLAALDTHLRCLDVATGQFGAPLARPTVTQSGFRFNDGKVDPRGRFIVGTLDQKFLSDGISYSVDGSGSSRTLGSAGMCFNGPCFSPDGRTYYYSDSVANKTYASDYDAATGTISNTRLFRQYERAEGAPDGCTIDAKGRLWAALCTGGKIGCFTTEGKLERAVEVPVMFPTSVAFGGPNLDVLYVTSLGDIEGLMKQAPPHVVELARRSLDAPNGALFAIHGLGVRGLPEPYFADDIG